VVSGDMPGVFDKLVLSTPLLVAIIVAYFTIVWKPRHSAGDVPLAAEIAFWSGVLTVIFLFVVYVGFFRQ
jgi:hypothetical protein